MSDNNFGNVDTAVLQQLNSLKKAAQDVTTEVGNIEVRKARLIGSLGEIESRAQHLLTEEGKRLGIPEGTAWQVTGEGEVILSQQTEVEQNESATA